MSSVSDNPGVYNGAYGMCRDTSGQLLLVHVCDGLDRGLWALPGGGVAWGEHPDDAVIRELREETGITDVRSLQVAALYSHKYMRSNDRPFDSVHHIGIIYDITVGPSQLRCEQDGSTDRCDWFTERQVRQLPVVPIVEFAVNLVWPSSELSDQAAP